MPDYSYDDQDTISKIKMGLHKGLRVVTIRSKEVYDTVKLKNKLQSKKKSKSKATREMGESVYQMFKVKNEYDLEIIRSKCVDIAKIDQEIADTEEEINLVHLNAKKKLGELKAISKPKENY
ncbi:MAG: hypothetical protein GTO02_10655 [Candidatus Dadabacteria bacterium]|nr:hypothetical protein [Candidatus Dadabacteria bacterium]